MPLDDMSSEASMTATPLVPSELFRETDSQLFRELVEEHSLRLRRFIIKHIGDISEADDIAQQTFLEAARSYQTFRGDSQLSTWLYGIALNLVRNYLSRAPERRYDLAGDTELATLVSNEPTPDEALYQREVILMLQDALAELPETLRAVLLMVGLDHLYYEEAALMLTVPVGTVRSRLSRARSALRAKLERKGLTLPF